MSARLALNDRAGSDSAQNNAAARSLLLTLPFAVVFLTIPDTIMRAIFAHGAFDANAAALSAIALAAYGVAVGAMPESAWFMKPLTVSLSELLADSSIQPVGDIGL